MNWDLVAIGHSVEECELLTSAGADRTALVLQALPDERDLEQIHGMGSSLTLCIPPFCDWSWLEWTTADVRQRLPGNLLISDHQLGNLGIESFLFREFEVELLSTPIEFDEEVGVAEIAMERFAEVVSAHFVTIGTGTSQPLQEQLREGEQFPEWCYLTERELKRLATEYPLHLGGNLPWSKATEVGSIVPESSLGVFVMSETGFRKPIAEFYGALELSRCLEILQELSQAADWLSRP